MKRMMNKKYSYENINLWDADAWKDRYSPICTLALWIEQKNHAILRERTKLGIYNGRTDGVYTFKSLSMAYPEVVKYWDGKGLFYKCDEMGFVNYIAMIPHAVRVGRVKDPTVLVVLHDSDYSDPNWAMDAVEYYREYNEMAAQEGLLILYVAPDGPDEKHMYINILQELAVIHRLNLDKVYLDLSTVFLAGTRLNEIPGFVYKDSNGKVLPNPDEAVEHIGTIPVLDITGRWHNKVSHLLELTKAHDPAIDLERIIHSACGKKMADGMKLEHTYEGALDPQLLETWEKMGLRYESHDKNGEQWVTLAPLCAYDQPEKKLPVMLIFQEVTYLDKFQALAALSSYHGYCDIAAHGELMLLFFALETPDDNELLHDILQDAAKIYPIDLSRVYVTGHSHNGHFCMEFMRRHHRAIAAVASLGNAYGIPAPVYSHEAWKVTDEMVDLMSSFDMPVIDICGITESDFSHNEPGTEGFKNAVDSWQRRLKAFNCPMKTYEEIAAAKTSEDYVTRMIGVPNDGTEIQYRYGCECYIADVTNKAGKHRLRLVALENLPHMCAPQMPELSWDFVRRFTRNLETGEVVDLYYTNGGVNSGES
jgi:hypothetical protein